MRNTVILLFLTSLQAMAASGGGHQEGIPTVVYWQAANLIIIFAGVAYFAGGKIKDAFKQRNQDFLAASEKSKSIQREAEQKLADIKNRLELLERTSSESIERARAEATDLRVQIIQEGRQSAEKIKQEAQAVARAEVVSAQRALHAQVVRESLRMARELLKKDVGAGDQQRLQ